MAKLEHRTLNDRAYEEIKKSLIAGRLRSGQILVIRTLAETYGISTTPVREALQRLVAERLLEMLPNRSIIVPYLSVERFVEIFQIRRQLEGFAAQLACERIRPTHLTRLRKLVDEMDQCLAENHGANYQIVNQKFHFTIYELANSPLLLQLIGDLWTHVGPFFSELTEGEAYFGIANDEHKRIVQALADKDVDAAVKHLQDDISIAADHLVERLKNMSKPAA